MVKKLLKKPVKVKPVVEQPEEVKVEVIQEVVQANLPQEFVPELEVQPEPVVDYVVVTKGEKQYKKFTRKEDGTTYLEGPIN